MPTAEGSVPIHDREADTSQPMVRALLRNQCPRWATLPLRLVDASGTDHAMWRLGDDLVVRVPRLESAAASLADEMRWLPLVDDLVGVPVPRLRHAGTPTAGYPHPWAVFDWIAARDGWGARDELEDPHGDAFARDLAAAVGRLRAAATLEVPRRQAGQRGGPLAGVLERIEGWLTADQPAGAIDATAVRRVAAACAEAADDDVRYVLTHGDLIPGNVLVRDGRLAGIIDWGYLSYADPALDVVPAWAILGARARAVFREVLAPDEATWRRARANALEQALGAIAYYVPRGHQLGQVMLRTLDRILRDTS